MIGHDIVVVREFFMANCAYSVLFDDLAIEQLAHFPRRAQFPVSPRVVRVLDSPNSRM